MEWYYHALLYPQAVMTILPSYVWKTVVGIKDFLVDVHDTKTKLVAKYEDDRDDESASDAETDTDTETE